MKTFDESNRSGFYSNYIKYTKNEEHIEFILKDAQTYKDEDDTMNIFMSYMSRPDAKGELIEKYNLNRF